MLAWLLHRRCHARCCLRPRGAGWYSSITHLPFRLRPLGKDRHDPKISVSRGYGSDSGLTPFTSLDLRISLCSWEIHYRAADWTLPGRTYAFAFPRDAGPAPGSNPKRSQPWLFTNAALGGLKPAPASRLRGAKQPSSFVQLRTLYSKVRSWRTTWRDPANINPPRQLCFLMISAIKINHTSVQISTFLRKCKKGKSLRMGIALLQIINLQKLLVTVRLNFLGLFQLIDVTLIGSGSKLFTGFIP